MENSPAPSLPQYIIDDQTAIATSFAKHENVTDVPSFVYAWLNGYYSAMVETGAIAPDDADGWHDLLDKMNKF
jgi:hypothetical protein